MDTTYAVQIVHIKTGKVEKNMDNEGKGHSLRQAERIQRGANINLNHKEYMVQLVICVRNESADQLQARLTGK